MTLLNTLHFKGYKKSLTAMSVILSLVFAVGFSSQSYANTFSSNYQQGVSAFKKGEWTEALSSFKSALRDNPNSPSVRYYVALLLDKFNHDEEALLQYQYVIKNSSDKKIVDFSQQRVQVLEKKPRIASIQPVGVSAFSPASTSGSQIVPLKRVTNALMVDVTLVNSSTGKSATGTFIIDTGATYTSISSDLAQQLGLNLNTGDSVRITTANGKINVPKVNLDQVSIGGVKAHDVESTVISLSHSSSFSGLLGLSFIKQFKMTIDPDSNQLVFEPR